MRSCFNCEHCMAPNGMLVCGVKLPAIVLIKEEAMRHEYKNFNLNEIYPKSPEKVADKCEWYTRKEDENDVPAN